MKKLFLSYHFDSAGNSLANKVQSLLRSHSLVVVTGTRLAGGNVTDEIKKRIDNCDGMICLFTRRAEGENNNWVRDERTYGLSKNKRIISLQDKSVPNDGMFSNREYIKYDPDKDSDSLLDLSETIGLWKSDYGRILTVEIEPVEAAKNARTNGSKIFFRKWRDDSPTEWQEVRAIPKPGSAQVLIRGVKEQDNIQLKIENGGNQWTTDLHSQTIRIPFLLDGD